MELYGRIRRAVFVEGKSQRAVALEFGVARETVRKMLRYAVPPGYRREQAVKRPKLGPWRGVVDAILADDQNQPKKQRHTAKRIFERLREEHGYRGGYTIVKDYVRLQKVCQQEMFVPLTHSPGLPCFWLQRTPPSLRELCCMLAAARLRRFEVTGQNPERPPASSTDSRGMCMKKFINRPENLVAELLEGLVLAFPDKIRLAGSNTIGRAIPKSPKKVQLITLGGSGHEPGLSGFVGEGMLDYSVAGEIFAAPGPPRVY